MANFFHASSFSHPLLLLVLLIVALSNSCDAVGEDRKVYIVYMGALSKGEEYSLTSQHLSMLEEVLEDSHITDNFVRSYQRSFNGFAVKLNEQEKQKLASKEGVVSVFPSKTLQLHTTRSWDFIGLSTAIKRIPTAESDVIVGVLDGGIWPESESFSDEGFGPPPKKWKGACKGGNNFTCNNKIIGARFYSNESDSVRDTDGHGTHTASTIAGNLVSNASFYGIAQGNARGGVPSARIAAYNVCGSKGCAESDVLAAFDDAIADGVDIISISIGTSIAGDFDIEAIAIGAFHAMQKGILTSQSAGNSGPDTQTIISIAPWILSVAASTIDRHIIDKVVLGDGKVLKGNSINSFTGTYHPLAYGKEVLNPAECNESWAGLCLQRCLDSDLVKGKVLLCDQLSMGEAAKKTGALGVLMSEDKHFDYSSPYPLPAIQIKKQAAEEVKSYMNSTKNPTANILKSEAENDSSAPTVVSFSSRGPNPITPDILKPDISAPGVNILAAFSPLGSVSFLDERKVKFNILSGTSMACPHATAAAAYVKSFHPNWSPSAIKSALMTTAWPMNATRNPDAEFAYGAGHINPVKAINPGLVYEILNDDYIKFLCNIGWDTKRVRSISGDNSSCPQGTKGTPLDLNYPSMTAYVQQKDKPFAINFTRTVKNVGSENSIYKTSVIITSHSNITISVKPSVLSFKSLNEDKSFVVTVSGSKLNPKTSMASASLEWSDGTHTVRSPIVVHSALI
ncbi:subtilisin-like protease SBT4.13 [Macadamia integrifolia]|uniref:subtilisin-like protease SBT4.13 n=1 Tax=Macadamia integrifolia TaxID=60698 RepID=UPI001C529275|nr:subtilisin-like protease SBT4.13 [Macadamia integrifolia]